jgi:Zn-dependent protease
MSTSGGDIEQGVDEPENAERLKRPALVREFGQSARPAESEPATDANNPFATDQYDPQSPPLAPLPRRVGILERWRAKGGILGAIATALLFLLKVAGPALFLLGKVKVFLLMGGSMAASIWLESKVFGWPLAVGIVLLIFIHECGHALAARLRGIPTGIMVFIPFMGAFVTTKRYGRNLVEDAFIGIMGPIIGSIAAALCLIGYPITHSLFWVQLAQWGMFINLFNLLPTPPLDGGWIAPLFSPKLLAVGMIIGVIVGFQNPMIWLLLLMSVPRIISGWKADPRTQPYYQVPTIEKWKFGLIYFGLAIALALGCTFTGALMVM